MKTTLGLAFASHSAMKNPSFLNRGMLLEKITYGEDLLCAAISSLIQTITQHIDIDSSGRKVST
jgi:hypothetical protein